MARRVGWIGLGWVAKAECGMRTAECEYNYGYGRGFLSLAAAPNNNATARAAFCYLPRKIPMSRMVIINPPATKTAKSPASIILSY